MAGPVAVGHAQNVKKLTDYSQYDPFGGDTSFCASNGLVFFTTDAGLWRSDGTTEGTKLIVAGITAKYFTDVNGVLYFSGHDPAYGSELWRSDGTTTGTFMVVDIQPGPYGGNPQQIRNADGTVFFTAEERNVGAGTIERNLWAYTPTPSPPPPAPGDVNRDDKTDVADVVALIEIITSGTATAAPPAPVIPRAH